MSVDPKMLPISGSTIQRIRELLKPDFAKLGRDSGGTTLVAIPIGGLIDYAGPTNPDSGIWLATDGASLAAATYPLLFAAIGYTHGGGGASFNVPDLRTRVAAGTGGIHATGDVVGADTVTLATGEIPAHAHGVTDPGHAHATVGTIGGGATDTLSQMVVADNNWDHTTSSAFTGIAIQNAGGGGAHANLQPTLYVTKWIRYQ